MVKKNLLSTMEFLDLASRKLEIVKPKIFKSSQDPYHLLLYFVLPSRVVEAGR
jgi:hypothetical protein